MSNKFSIQVGGHGDQWDRIASQVEKFGEANEWPPDIVFTIRLILEELILNAVDYGTEDQSTEVQLDLLSEADAIRIELKDNGKAYNPLEEAPTPDFGSDVEDRPIGGLGVHLVKQLSDELEYQHLDGFNKLTIVKRREAP